MSSLIDEVLKEAGFSDAAIADVKAGKLHYGGSLDAASDKELSVKLAFHVEGKIDNIKLIFLRLPAKKKYDPTVGDLGMIATDGGDGSLEDFAGVKLSPNEAAMDKLYSNAAPGSDLNLSQEEIEIFKKLGKNATHEQIENTLKQILLDRFRAYKKNGLAGIKPYARAKKEFSAGEELKNQILHGPILKKRAPVFHNYALDYPNNKPEEAEESFFWVNSIIDDKPTIALVHRVGMPHSGGYVYMERHFYISRSHNCLQGIGAAMTQGDEETVVLYATRTSTDQVSGFGSAAKRTIGNKVMGGRMAENFERARKVLAASKDLSLRNLSLDD
ncbi:hypothetical protein ACHAXM_010783 [Skeletonema potamos]